MRSPKGESDRRYLLKRPVGRPPKDVRRYHASFSYRAQSRTKSRRVVTKVEWHPGELYPSVGFIVTNLSRPAERAIALHSQRGTAEQWMKDGKNAIKWTRLSFRRFRDSAVRLQLHALAYNLGNFMRTLAHARLRILWCAWVERNPYDPARHRAAQFVAA